MVINKLNDINVHSMIYYSNSVFSAGHKVCKTNTDISKADIQMFEWCFFHLFLFFVSFVLFFYVLAIRNANADVPTNR